MHEFMEQIINIMIIILVVLGLISLIKFSMNTLRTREVKPATQDDIACAIIIILMAIYGLK